jgi:Peptidase M15
MPDAVAELTRKIRAKLAELEDDQAERREASKIVNGGQVRVETAARELGRARRRVRRRLTKIADLRDDLKALEAKTPDVETAAERELAALLDELAGQLEEDIATRDRWLDRLDRAQVRVARAKAALEAAVAESAEDREALERLRARRKRAQQAGADRPSPNFTWAEFDCNDGTPIPEASKPAIRAWCAKIGEPLRARFGAVHVNSGHRHRAYNASIGGEPNSVHIYDYPGRLPPQDDGAVAVDFRCATGSPAEWYAFTAGKADGRGRYATFHHADNRNRIGWPDSTWQG